MLIPSPAVIQRAICLGRTPGYRKRDVEQAFISSIVEVM